MRRVLAAAGLVAAVLLISCGPHMTRQYGLRPYKRELPPMPAGTVPVPAGTGTQSGYVPVPTEAEAASRHNPLPASPEVLEKGARYYGYYCAHCHGGDGRSHTPVGDSYNPRPADLTAGEVQALSDGDLYRRMLTGAGHEPVMASTVAPERRWYVVSYLRVLRGGRP